jgi:hypothetical protein
MSAAESTIKQRGSVYPEQARSPGRRISSCAKSGGNAGDNQPDDKMPAERTDDANYGHLREHDVQHDPVPFRFKELGGMRLHCNLVLA